MFLTSPAATHAPLLGRTPLIEYLGAQLRPAARTRVVVLHGEAGVGKSALVRELAAAWEQGGGVVVEATPGEAPAPADTRRLLLVDPLGLALPRGSTVWLPLLDTMGPDDRLLIAARVPVRLPVDDARLVELRVTPLGWDDAMGVLAREGVGAEDRPALVRWSRGLPLLLVLGAQAQLQHADWDPASEEEPEGLTERLERRTAERALVPTPRLNEAAVREAAKQAVRDYTSVDRLGRSTLGRGATPAARAAHVRALVDDAIEQAFGTSRADAGLREVLVRGYLVADKPHEQIADDLFVSRTTYFRQLRAGLARAGEQLAGTVIATA